MNASPLLARYLGEAKASEDALVRVLQSQIAMTPSGSYRSGLESHLDETRDHSRRVAGRIRELSGRRTPLVLAVTLSESLVGQAMALAKTPLDLLRGSGGDEKVLKNAKDACATEALEIATYTAIERLAQTLGDEKTVRLAQDIRADEERMLARIMRELPGLTDAFARAELADDPTYDVTRTGAAQAVRTAGDTLAGDAADDDDLAIRDYDDLTADEINARLRDLSQTDLAKVDAYERRHENRTTVRKRIETLRGDEPWRGYDELTVSEVQKALDTRTDEQISELRAYETAHKHRIGVLRATERRVTTS
jgi:ferritin-like metal-binding protein YciE